MRLRPPSPRSTALRIGAIAVAAVVTAEVAVLLLRPRGETLEPLAVSATAYFDPSQIERAEAFRDGQRLLGLAGAAATIGLLGILAAGRPRAAAAALERLGRRPVLGAAAAGAALSLAVAAAGLPFAAAAQARAADYGLSTQGLPGWLGDQAGAGAIAAVLAAAGATLLLALVRRLPRGWWLPAAAAVVAYAIVFVTLAPVLLAPIFNDFDRLSEGPARETVNELTERAEVEIEEIYRVDASRRSVALNAYVSGLGPTKRVVVYDNLLREAERPALRSLLAHELAHVSNHDLWRGIAFVAIVAPLAMLFAREAGSALAGRRQIDPGSPAALPAYALALAVAGAVLGVAGNQLSRDVERAADNDALQLTGDPAALIELQTRLAERNLSDPDPPAWAHFMLGSHPTTLERIGIAEAHARRRSE